MLAARSVSICAGNQKFSAISYWRCLTRHRVESSWSTKTSSCGSTRTRVKSYTMDLPFSSSFFKSLVQTSKSTSTTRSKSSNSLNSQITKAMLYCGSLQWSTSLPILNTESLVLTTRISTWWTFSPELSNLFAKDSITQLLRSKRIGSTEMKRVGRKRKLQPSWSVFTLTWKTTGPGRRTQPVTPKYWLLQLRWLRFVPS